MCAPVARNSRASAQDRNLRSASTSIPGPKQPDSSRSRARACSESRYGPIEAPSRLPVPDSAAASHRTCGNAPSRAWLDGRPKCSSFAALSGTSDVDPSMDTTRCPQQDTPGAPSSPIGPVTCSNKNRTGAGPSLPRPRDSEEIFGGFHRRPRPRQPSRPGPAAARPAGHRRAADGTARRPAWPSPARTHSSGPGTATTRARNTSPAAPAEPASLLPRPGSGHRGVHQLRRENPGQDADRDPVRQPAVRREPLSAIMRPATRSEI